MFYDLMVVVRDHGLFMDRYRSILRYRDLGLIRSSFIIIRVIRGFRGWGFGGWVVIFGGGLSLFFVLFYFILIEKVNHNSGF